MSWLQRGHYIVSFFHLLGRGFSIHKDPAHKIWLGILSVSHEEALNVYLMTKLILFSLLRPFSFVPALSHFSD